MFGVSYGLVSWYSIGSVVSVCEIIRLICGWVFGFRLVWVLMILMLARLSCCMVLCRKWIPPLPDLIRVMWSLGCVTVSGTFGSFGLALRLVTVGVVMRGSIISELSRRWGITVLGLWIVARPQVRP